VLATALGTTGAAAQNPPEGEGAQGHPVRVIAEEADRRMAHMDPAGALAILDAALLAWPGRSELRWRAADAAIAQGFLAPDADSALTAYRTAEHHARAILSEDPASLAGRYRLLISLGRQAYHEDIRDQAGLLRETYFLSEDILEDEPGHAGTHHVMGTFHTEVMRAPRVLRWVGANLLGVDALKYVSWEQAEYHHDRTITLEPDVVLHRTRRGEFYMLQKRYDEAMADFDVALALPETHPIDGLMKSEVRGFVARVEREKAEEDSR
jgi:tetratricopeptide (TPR) repeat protein